METESSLPFNNIPPLVCILSHHTPSKLRI